MPTNNDELISEQFDRLSPALRKIIIDLDLGPVLDGLRTKYGLHVDQIGVISDQIMLTMVGLAGIQDFTETIKNKVGLSSDVANLITYDLNSQVFLKIRHELEKITAPDGSVRESQEVIRDSAQAMFEQKMGGVNNIPKQEVEVKTQTGDNKTEAPTAQPRDPYREAI